MSRYKCRKAEGVDNTEFCIPEIQISESRPAGRQGVKECVLRIDVRRIAHGHLKKPVLEQEMNILARVDMEFAPIEGERSEHVPHEISPYRNDGLLSDAQTHRTASEHGHGHEDCSKRAHDTERDVVAELEENSYNESQRTSKSQSAVTLCSHESTGCNSQGHWDSSCTSTCDRAGQGLPDNSFACSSRITWPTLARELPYFNDEGGQPALAALGGKVSSFAESIADGWPFALGRAGANRPSRERSAAGSDAAHGPVLKLPQVPRQALPFRTDWELKHLLESPRQREDLVKRVLNARADRFQDSDDEESSIVSECDASDCERSNTADTYD